MAKTEKLDPSQETVSPNGKVDWLDPSDENQLRQIIFQSEDRPEELVEVPLWRVRILVRAMSGTQRAIYEALPRDKETGRLKDLRHVYFEVARMCCVHPRTRKPFFQVADEGTVMDEKNGAIIDMLSSLALRLSEMLPSQRENARKNSETTPTFTTTSDSQNDSGTKAE